MKKNIALAVILASIMFSMNAEKHLISFSFGISSGIPFYDSEEVLEKNESLESAKRFVIGTYGLVNLNLIEYASVYTGVNFTSDFNWGDDSYYANHLHLDIPLGLRLSPGLGGFSFGTAYLLGFRSDFYNNAVDEKTSDISPWGNGFQLFTEFDFSSLGNKFYPTAGISWTIIPRGNYSYDNLLNLYIGLNL